MRVTTATPHTMEMYFRKKALKYAPSSTPIEQRYILKMPKSNTVNFRTAFIEFFMRLHMIVCFKFDCKINNNLKNKNYATRR